MKAPTTPISSQQVVHMDSNSNLEQSVTFNERLAGSVAARDALNRSDENLTQTAFNAPISGVEPMFYNADVIPFETLLQHPLERPRSSQTMGDEPHQYASSLGQKDSKRCDDGDGALTLDMKLCGSAEEQDPAHEAALNLQRLSTAGPLPSYDSESTNSQSWKTGSTTAYPSLTSPAWDYTGKSRRVCDGVNQFLDTPPRTPVDGITLCTSLDYSYDNTPRSHKTYVDDDRTNVQPLVMNDSQNVPFAVRCIPITRSCWTPQTLLAPYQWRAQNQATLHFRSRCCQGLSIDPHATRGQRPCSNQQSRCC
jgi:hypothetical protein